MNAVISSSNIKTFSSALTCLSRFSETFWLQASPRAHTGAAQLRLSAINQTNSAFCMFVFDNDFFLRATIPSNERVECQLALKPVLGILRTRAKTVERCELDLVDDADECRFSIKLHCHQGVLKTHRLTYEPKRGLLPTADPNPPHYICVNAQTAHEWTEHFLSSSKGGEITFWCGPDFCIVKSKEDEAPEVRGQMRRAIHTEVKIDLSEFKEYNVAEEAILTFSLREFKATATLAEILQVPLEISFSDGDEPVFIHLNVESVVAEFVLATSRGERPDADGVSKEAPPDNPRARAAASSHRPANPATQASESKGRAALREPAVHVPAPTASPYTQQKLVIHRPALMEASDEASVPSAESMSQSAPHLDVPMESTPHPGVSQRSSRHAASPPPLFFPGASQDSMIEATPLPQASLYNDGPQQTPGNGGVEEGHEGSFDDDFADADFAALDEVERSIQRGETELIGSQLVLRTASGREVSGEATRNAGESAQNADSDARRNGSTEFPEHRPQRSAADRKIRLERVSERDESGVDATAEDAAGSTGSRWHNGVGHDDDDSDDNDDDGQVLASRERKRFRPLF
ncbi:hypothetical protein ACQY0O_005990 [Thecaphora frezii]